MAEIIQPGAKVAWVSQAHGSWVEKRGVVVAYLPAGQDARDVLTVLGVEGRLMAQPVSKVDRYLVRVQARRTTRIYAPRADQMEKAVAGEQGQP